MAPLVTSETSAETDPFDLFVPNYADLLFGALLTLLRTAVEAHGLGGQQRRCCISLLCLQPRSDVPSGRAVVGSWPAWKDARRAHGLGCDRHLPLTKSLRSGIIGATWMTH
jgi:hypothetical protein